MRQFHPVSFILGVATGLAMLMLFVGAFRLLGPSAEPGFPPMGGGNWEQRQGGSPNIGRMADRLGMTEEELRTEMESGKTVQEIARERGIEDFPAPGGMRGNRMRSEDQQQPASATASGSLSSSSSSSSSSVSSF